MTIPALPLDVNQPGVIGTRSVRVLQLMRIGRHPSTVMLVPAQGLWVVSGRGPQAGSNGAGKTVLLGALSLLHGDAQWNGGSGTGPNAARLLFDHDRARVADRTYGSASHGYIAGVFYGAGADQPVSVWMRIERHSAQYVQVRWEDGVHLAVGDSEAARAESADAMWNSLRLNGTVKVTEYAARLYGDAPRCIASIRARGSEENQDRGLLALGHRSFRPADLASQVIMLAGKQNALDAERELRQDLDANEVSLASKKKAFQEQFHREERELADIARRRQARSLSASAAQAWDAYLTLAHLIAHHEARELDAAIQDLDAQITQKGAAITAKQAELDGLPSRADLMRRLAEARQRRDTAVKAKEGVTGEEGKNSQRQNDLEARISELSPLAALALGVTVGAAESSLTKARDGLRDADRDYGKAERDLEEASNFLEKLTAGTGGPAGPALVALHAAGIDTASILDLITLPEAGRAVWEARLSPYVSTIVVSRHDDTASTRGILAAHPGIQVILCDGPVSALKKAAPEDDGLLGRLLRRLGERMPETEHDWVEDRELSLVVRGGYDPPLTDKQSAIAAARDVVGSLQKRLDEQRLRQNSADDAVARAEELLSAAKASMEIASKRDELDQLLREARDLIEKIEAARKIEEESRAAFSTADEEFKSADQRRREMNTDLETLKNGSTVLGSPPGRTQLRQAIAEAREKGRKQRETIESLRQISGINNLDAAEATLAESGTALDYSTMASYFHEARKQLRLAVEAVLDRPAAVDGEQTVPDEDRVRAIGDEAHHLQLNAGLRELHAWCDSQQSAERSARQFESVERPLRLWLDWNGADDETREADIDASRAKEKAQIEAAEHETEESRKWFEGRQDIQIGIIEKMFQNTERTLRELLDAVGQDPVALRPRHMDVKDISQPLRWELFPQWLPPGRKPVDYSNPPNTAELIILHLLLAISSLVAATTPRGRMLILDESGNNLDGPNLTRVSRVLRQVAEKYGLTVVLACQDLYTDLVVEHAAGMIQLVRSSPKNALNVPPAIIQGEEDRGIAEALGSYLRMGRPEGPQHR